MECVAVRAAVRCWHRFKRNLLDTGVLDVDGWGFFVATGPWVHSSVMAVFVIVLGISVRRGWCRVVVFVVGFGFWSSVWMAERNSVGNGEAVDSGERFFLRLGRCVRVCAQHGF